ncbi:sialomucin core protein 24-like [Mercenaria mercenaria]|uniref:sialomucin core protein 24-like n=1 Tax=Mercenaria mercenaria TaxID=6596 RepID=UPI00234ECB2D|nr:sialomucin core protein 24-like [Mercenaria mercenaria]
MKFISFAFCLLILCFASTVTAAEEATEEVCAALTEDKKCCNTTGCMWFFCENATATKNITECHSTNWTAVDSCKNNTQKQICEKPASPSTAATTTQAPVEVDPCKNVTDKTSCCTINGCVFTNCTSTDDTITDPVQVCVKNETVSTVCKLDTNKDQCAPSTSTPTPTPTQPTDVCESYNSSEIDCCSHTDQNCTYIKCTDPNDNAHTGCHVQSSDTSMSKFCKDEPKFLCSAPTPNPDVTTQPATNGSSTPTPDADANSGEAEHSQHFDGASFIGGIVLCLGLVAIAFFGVKFYRARAERNYHTL